jgi:hypothetical protein
VFLESNNNSDNEYDIIEKEDSIIGDNNILEAANNETEDILDETNVNEYPIHYDID